MFNIFQSSTGACNAPKPGAFDFVGKAKWTAWNDLGNLSQVLKVLIIIICEFLSPGQTDSQVDASQRKFAKPEFAYGLAKGGQTDSQVAKSRKFHAYHWLMRFYNNRLLVISTCTGWANSKKLLSTCVQI